MSDRGSAWADARQRLQKLALHSMVPVHHALSLVDHPFGILGCDATGVLQGASQLTRQHLCNLRQ